MFWFCFSVYLVVIRLFSQGEIEIAKSVILSDGQSLGDVEKGKSFLFGFQCLPG
jgi:hypothetical protein